MPFFLPNKLNPQGQRLLTIIIALPVFVSTSYILYKRLVLEEGVHGPMSRNQTPVTSDDLFAQYEKDLEKERLQQQSQDPSAGSSSSTSHSY
ncbi:hypothetical protein BC939DRAFT_445490 [Gamsiella multidivaricata]|uniref:uncharacterized protein n=1 Tax=Gamsiella multidivaricata TaxID=101098 RepID=UPI002220D4B6|nr:uncharacterized protein BC939DRAFT_445490 [Gamsiella multidivaricata]KAI7827525.1 hypothetical protein BC939DRAFT_445490 [Gamsiella multidivaricata]